MKNDSYTRDETDGIVRVTYHGTSGQYRLGDVCTWPGVLAKLTGIGNLRATLLDAQSHKLIWDGPASSCPQTRPDA